jgi:hypothetical protein
MLTILLASLGVDTITPLPVTLSSIYNDNKLCSTVYECKNDQNISRRSVNLKNLKVYYIEKE